MTRQVLVENHGDIQTNICWLSPRRRWGECASRDSQAVPDLQANFIFATDRSRVAIWSTPRTELQTDGRRLPLLCFLWVNKLYVPARRAIPIDDRSKDERFKRLV